MARTIIAGFVLIIICSIGGYFITSRMQNIDPWLGRAAGFIFVALVLIIAGVVKRMSPRAVLQKLWPQRKGSVKIIDTSAIIDGRIAEVCKTGFIEGTLVVPRFVLEELQRIADSSDPLKRTKGRRGLDILNTIQKHEGMDVRVVDQDFPKTREVDSKLVALAITMDAKIITNDYNLNKVAQLQGVEVLNVNELAYAVKPAVLPGETLNVQIIREGKEPEQGVAYLEDGTMVVVEGGKRHLGKTIEVTVTSVLQTAAGLMIFTTPKEGVGVGKVRHAAIQR
jgi:uncharacterized protein YacL